MVRYQSLEEVTMDGDTLRSEGIEKELVSQLKEMLKNSSRKTLLER